MSKKDRTEPRRLKGFRDYLPALMAERLAVIDVIRKEAALAGFQAIGTPALEYAETLLGQGGDETDKQTYRFKDNGDRDVALRFDLTVPFARFVAEHQNDLAFPFKKLQIGEVWRGENTQKGRYREFCQCDLDIIGVDSATADVEILAVFQRVLSQVDCGPFTMAVGNRVILSALIRNFVPGLDDAGEARALIALDKLGKTRVEFDQVFAERAPEFLTLLSTQDAAGDTDLMPVATLLEGDDKAQAEITRTRQVLALVRAGMPAKAVSTGKIRLDLTIARGLGYYTGVVFETTLDALPGFGSVASGGRYNNLASRFTSRELPGVGGSVGLDRLIAGMEELGKVKERQSREKKPVFVAIATDDAVAYGFALLAKLRDAGFSADVGMTPKLGNQLKHADKLGSAHVVLVGTTERENGTYSVKTMADGTEKKGLNLAAVLAMVAQ